METSSRSRYDPEWDERTWKRFGNVSRRQVELETFSSIPEPSVLFAFATLAAIDCRTLFSECWVQAAFDILQAALLANNPPPRSQSRRCYSFEAINQSN
jgi:hypothetical protein